MYEVQDITSNKKIIPYKLKEMELTDEELIKISIAFDDVVILANGLMMKEIASSDASYSVNDITCDLMFVNVQGIQSKSYRCFMYKYDTSGIVKISTSLVSRQGNEITLIIIGKEVYALTGLTCRVEEGIIHTIIWTRTADTYQSTYIMVYNNTEKKIEWSGYAKEPPIHAMGPNETQWVDLDNNIWHLNERYGLSADSGIFAKKNIKTGKVQPVIMDIEDILANENIDLT